MKFVGERVDDDEQQREEKPAASQKLMRRGDECSRRKKAEDSILRQMPQLAHQEMSEGQILFADAGIEPQQQRPYDARRI